MLQGFRTKTNIARLYQIINLIKKHYSIDLSISPDEIYFCDSTVRGTIGMYTGWLFIDNDNEYSIEHWENGRRHSSETPAMFSVLLKHQTTVLFSGWFKEGYVHRIDDYAKQWIDLNIGSDFCSPEYIIDGIRKSEDEFWADSQVLKYKLESILT